MVAAHGKGTGNAKWTSGRTTATTTVTTSTGAAGRMKAVRARRRGKLLLTATIITLRRFAAVGAAGVEEATV